MSGMEVLQCISGITSAFQRAGDVAKVLQERREKKKRKKERDIEASVEGKYPRI